MFEDWHIKLLQPTDKSIISLLNHTTAFRMLLVHVIKAVNNSESQQISVLQAMESIQSAWSRDSHYKSEQ